MMKAKKNTFLPANIGLSFMLVMFIVLCMIILAVLSLSTALKDQHLSETHAKTVSQYYQATNLVEEKLAQIDKEIMEGTLTTSTVSFTIPIDETKALQIVLNIHPEKETRYTIVSWHQISTVDWNGTQTLPVLGNH